jgi:hypothetical protein
LRDGITFIRKGERRKFWVASAEAKLALIMPSHEKFHEDEVRINDINRHL